MQTISDIRLDGLIPLDSKRFYELVEAAKRRRASDSRTPSQRRCDELNAERNWLDPAEYDCKHCNNRGYTAIVNRKNGYDYILMPECRCMEIRRAIWRMKKSGLYNVIRRYTLDKFIVREPWQQVMLDTARKYIACGLQKGAWFFAGGQPGCGKSHLCTAIAREALYRHPVIYMMWEEESKKLKALVNDPEEYRRMISPMKSVEVLYIDDLFKPTYDEYGKKRLPTAADMKLAFEIINYRYVNQKPTIISTEWSMKSIAGFDEATASRIAEQCGEYQLVIDQDPRKNQRFSGNA